MKNLIQIVIIVAFLFSCKSESKKEVKDGHQHPKVEKKETSKKKVLSPHTYAMSMVGDAHVHIDYSSPGVRGRIIFGGLLAYDQVWQAGAHKATWLDTTKDLIVAGKELKAGKYGIFMIPSKGEWTIIFNTNWDQHGKDDYDEKEDVLRFKVTPKISDEIQEHLEYKVSKTNKTSGSIRMSWEKISIEFLFNVN
ncbi:MAG: DUF2911 domain-containing protein [Flavobacteriaceae bacterium]|nr:DUF2911 domain-containing protein [Flavobacteriaceae bacterium]